MAGRRFIDLVTDAESLAVLTSERAMVRRLTNDGLADIASKHYWPFLWTRSFFTTVAVYETGTVTVTNGSATVTGSGTTFTSAMVGRKFRVGNDNAFYRISAFVSTTELTLEANYQGTTASAQTYSIYQDEYLLRADVDYYKVVRQIENGVALLSMNISEFDVLVPTPESQGNAHIECFIGRNNEEYTTGTVSMTSGSRTLTGVSTAWLSARGLSKGTKLRISDVLFTVNTVDSDTQITTYEAATSTIAALTTYAAIIDNPIVQLYEIPDTAENYYYRFQRIPAVMNRDGDIPDGLPHPIHPLILDYTMIYLWEHKGFTERMISARKRYEDRLRQAILRYGHSNPDRVYRKHPEDGFPWATRRLPRLRVDLSTS